MFLDFFLRVIRRNGTGGFSKQVLCPTGQSEITKVVFQWLMTNCSISHSCAWYSEHLEVGISGLWDILELPHSPYIHSVPFRRKLILLLTVTILYFFRIPLYKDTLWNYRSSRFVSKPKIVAVCNKFPSIHIHCLQKRILFLWCFTYVN